MSRRTNFYDAINGINNSYLTVVFIDNIPSPILANEYANYVCIAANACLVSSVQDVMSAISLLNITKNQ